MADTTNGQTATDAIEAEPAPPAWEPNRIGQVWAIVEIFGHKVRAGSISDAEIGGGTFLRVEHPTVPDHAGSGPLVELYGREAIFSVRPCSREEATEWAEARWRRNVAPMALAELEAVPAHVLDDEDIWDDDELSPEPL